MLSLADEKNRLATPIIGQARALRAAIFHAAHPTDLTKTPNIERALAAAAGISEDMIKRLQPEELSNAINIFLTEFPEARRLCFQRRTHLSVHR